LEPDITGRYGAPPHDNTGHTWHHDDDLLIRIIREGGMGDPVNFYVMPALGSVLSDAEIEAVVAYIKTMWTSEQQTAQREGTLAVRSRTLR
jgi:mono/diheme cytochrome c family protein